MNSDLPNASTPTVAHLNEARLRRWHQTGEALLTAENLRSWINAAGMVLFTPRPQVVAPAPSLVEAVLGATSSEPELKAISEARGLFSRLIADGIAVPLNLTGAGQGTPGDTPDYVVSAAAFAYVFTLRGDKAWKQPPATSGPLKVSNLALAAYEALSAEGPLSAYDLATHLGKEVTETACLRALNELWSHLRVIPLAQQDGRATVWELTSARFTKQIKAGANAGQPTALSALISLYLGQVLAATEEEIESFLSPLAPRSRIREVLHALLSARQLDTIAMEGRTLLHVAGESLSFGAQTASLAVEASAVSDTAEEQTSQSDSRITKYVPRPRKIGTGYLSKGRPVPGKRPFERDGGSRGRTEGFKPRPATGSSERERRPFRKTAGAEPKRFDKPWQENRPQRETSGSDRRPKDSRVGGRESRPSRATGGDRRQDTRGEFRGGPRPPRRDGSGYARPPRADGLREGQNRREDGRGRRPRTEQQSREGHRESTSRKNMEPGRPPFRRFDAPKRERPAQREGSERRPYTPRPEGSRPTPRPRDGEFKPRSPQRNDDTRGYTARPPRSRDGEFKPRSPRRTDDTRGYTPRPPRREGSSAGRPPRKDGDRSFGKARPFSKSGTGGGGGKFAKPAGKKRPFDKKQSGGPFKPTKKSFDKKPRRDESA